MYLFSLLSSPLNRYVFEKLFQLENEQYGTFLVIRRIKEFLRVPKITKTNQAVKDEIMRCAVEMLDLEDKTLSDFVDFSGILMQRFADVQIAGDTLVLSYNGGKTELPIKGGPKLVASTIAEWFGTRGLKLEKHRISLSDLRNLQVIDFEKQVKLKEYIDDLVFALYFKIPLKEVGLDRVEEMQKACSGSKYYQLL